MNVRASSRMAKAVWADMREQGGGTVVNVSSAAGRRGRANASAYCAAMLGLTQSLAAEGRPHGCLLYPEAMDTSRGMWFPENRRDGAKPTVPADALAPEQVARLITWIATAPPDVVLNEVTVTPLLGQGRP